jgi:hypothetical protein
MPLSHLRVVAAGLVTLIFAAPAAAQITLDFSADVRDAFKTAGKNPEIERRRAERRINAGFKELAKTNEGAKAIYDSKQKIRIVCYDSDEAKKAGLLFNPSSPTVDAASTRGDFDTQGKPKPGGTAIIAMDCKLLELGGFEKQVDLTRTVFGVLIHELLHTTDKKRIHDNSPEADPLSLYETWTNDFLAYLNRRDVRQALRREDAGDPKAVAEAEKKAAAQPPASQPASPPASQPAAPPAVPPPGAPPGAPPGGPPGGSIGQAPPYSPLSGLLGGIFGGGQPAGTPPANPLGGLLGGLLGGGQPGDPAPANPLAGLLGGLLSSPPVVEPYVAGGVRFNDADGAYLSTGAQPAGTGAGSRSDGNGCGGVDARLTWGGSMSAFRRWLDDNGTTPIFLGATEFGGRFGVCYLGGGEKVVFKEVRHPGADGTVTLSERERTEISLFLLLQQNFYIDVGRLFRPRSAGFGEQFAAVGTDAGVGRGAGRLYWPFALYVGGGLTFVSTDISLKSNQTGAGGGLDITRQTKTDVAWSFLVGGKAALCRDCVFGSPAMAGVEAQWTWLPARDVTLPSSAFGFAETGRVSARASTRVLFRLSVPFQIGP